MAAADPPGEGEPAGTDTALSGDVLRLLGIQAVVVAALFGAEEAGDVLLVIKRRVGGWLMLVALAFLIASSCASASLIFARWTARTGRAFSPTRAVQLAWRTVAVHVVVVTVATVAMSGAPGAAIIALAIALPSAGLAYAATLAGFALGRGRASTSGT